MESASADSLDRPTVEKKYTKLASRVPSPAKLIGKYESILAQAIKKAIL